MYKKYVYIILIILGIYFLYECPFEHVLGISCMGCGMTRAFMSLLELDLSRAFYYHPLFIVVIFTCIYLLLKHFKLFKMSDKYEKIAFYIIVLAFVIVYFIRMFSGSEIVKVDFDSSLIYRIYKLIYV